MAGHHTGTSRVDWVDFSKGICIILVVLLNTTYGVEKVTGTATFFNTVNDWARPFRMPDFFFIAGLFLMRRIDRPWRSYLDTKVVHFAYFYVLWMSVWYIVRIPVYIDRMGLDNALLLYPMSFIEPLGSLWFIYMLAVFFVVAKLTRPLPVWLVWLAGAVLHSLQIHTGWRVIDEFSSRFVFFYSGFVFAPYAFSIASFFTRQKVATIVAGLVIWAVIEGWLVFGGHSLLPGVSLALGFAGTGAIITAGILLSKTRLGEPVRYLGEHSLVVFLSYFLFSVAARIIMLKTGLVSDPVVLITLATLAGITGPVIADLITRNTPLFFLYRRPYAFRLGGMRQAAPVRRQGKTTPAAGGN